jgi:hypothetical protein
MDLLYSSIALVLIALIWAGIVFLSFKRKIGHQTKLDKRILLGGILLFLAMIGIVIAGTVAFEYMESPKFCGTFCHVMEPYYDSYIFPGNNSMMASHSDIEISCSNCHNEPGIVGTIKGLLSAIPEGYAFVTGSYDPEHLGGEFSREACLKCHDGDIANIPTEVTTVIGTVVNPHSDEELCTDCHSSHHEGLGLNKGACSVCHGTSLDNFKEMISDHANRAGEDCMSCHNRKHPTDARISFSEFPSLINTDFCSDCHEEDINRLKRGPHKSKNCMDCHNEHGTLSINFNECGQPCHNPPSEHDETLSNCAICHDASRIHLKSGTDTGGSFSDLVCANCHVAENSAYQSSFTSEAKKIYGNNYCIDCHSDHNTIIYPHQKTVPFNDCDSCHSTYNQPSTVHDRTEISYLGFSGITNDFCSDCHGVETERLNSAVIHADRDCIECHSDHEISVEFDNCNACHDPPSGHDTSTDSCSNCHIKLSKIHSEGEGEDPGGSEEPNENCLSCHDGKPGPVPPTQVTTAAGTVINPHVDDSRDCTDCHTTLHSGFSGLNTETCTLCHGTTRDDFASNLLDHSNRVGEDCMSCHDRDHPSDARIPFLEYPSIINKQFCSDCHEGEVFRLRWEYHNSRECIECHSEHRTLNVELNNCVSVPCHEPQAHDDSFNNCFDSTCHVNTKEIHFEE